VRTLKTFQGTHILGASRGLLCDSYAVLLYFVNSSGLDVRRGIGTAGLGCFMLLFQLHVYQSEMLSPRRKNDLGDKILASASASKLCPRPQTFGFILASVVCSLSSSQEETDQSVCRLQDIT